MENLILIFIGLLMIGLVIAFRIAKDLNIVIEPSKEHDDELRELILTAAYWERKALESYSATDIMKYQKLATAANQKALTLSGNFTPPDAIEKHQNAKVVNLNDYK